MPHSTNQDAHRQTKTNTSRNIASFDGDEINIISVTASPLPLSVLFSCQHRLHPSLDKKPINFIQRFGARSKLELRE